ncbi:hypothetical protein [Streptomyces sp. NPDC056361]|uniref:hypothetical protein n=1 Tax=Streptomyces sp. NPDC056361 TaxID=3345795 RepID=UPI0035D72639
MTARPLPVECLLHIDDLADIEEQATLARQMATANLGTRYTPQTNSRPPQAGACMAVAVRGQGVVEQ